MKLTDEQIARIKGLEDARRQLAPDSVVEDAKDKRSPLHALFEWDRSKAARAHWLDRAREIIGAVRVVVTTQDVSIKTPCYVRDPEASGQGYRSVAALRGDPAQARASLVFTLEVAAGHLRRAYDLATPLGLDGDIDAILLQVAGVQRRTKDAAAAA